MSIRHSLLAILDQGDCYGYQLRVEFERRTGQSRSLNVGQVYATLDRLERDGFVTKLGANSTGHVYYAITGAGRLELAAWFDTAAPGTGLHQLAVKVALVQSLPGVDARAVLGRQRESTVATLDDLRTQGPVSDLSRQIVVDAQIVAAEAELEWLTHAESLLLRSEPFGLDVDPPRRGRPVRV